jgi:hypothetical protein
VINANLIQGNSADSGSGGGIRLNQVNGTDVSTFPNTAGGACGFNCWNNVSITNNIINNNIAGWDGAGISLQDALNVQIVNNTIAHNDSLASSGVLTTSIGTPMASAPAGDCHNAAGTASCPQSAGVTSTKNSTLLTDTFTGLTLTCPTGQPGCRNFSNPLLANNIIWQNRSFYIGITGSGAGTLNQQNLVSLFDAFTNTPAPNQAASGSCAAAPGSQAFPAGSYWDIGVRGDTSRTPGSNINGFRLHPTYSVVSTPGYGGPGDHNTTSDPLVVSQYCNGSRVPAECTVADGCAGPKGFGVPPGINDAVTPNPRFGLTPSATVDEGNNWINVSWGPLSETNPALPSTGAGSTGNYGGGPALANYNLTAASPARDFIPASGPNAQAHPVTDFYGNARPETNEGGNPRFDVGAIEFASSSAVISASLTPAPWAAGPATRGCIGFFCPTTVFFLTNTGNVPLTGIQPPTVGGTNAGDFAILLSTCGTMMNQLAPGGFCLIIGQFAPPASDTTGPKTATLAIDDAAGTQTSSLNGTAN